MEFEYQGRTFTCRIIRKKMKTIRIRVKEDGIIHVSAPHEASEECIRGFLLEHAAELAQLLDHAKAQRASVQNYTSGSVHHWLGRTITLRWMSTPRPPMLENGVLSLFARTEQEAQTAYRQWVISECTVLYKRINREVCEAFLKKGYAVPIAHVQIKEMTSRWGSCTPSSGRLSINFKLMQYPVECIRGVFCHEYAHFLHQDHSSAFYDVLLSVYPEYRKWDAVLKKPLW